VEREAVIADWKRRFGRPALWSGEGCELCNGKGYKGRMAIFEVLEVTPEIRHLIRVQRGTGEILRAAIAGGMLTLRQDGIEKALAGKTDMTEVRGACS
jgi:type II secretory ATPase GspE/PulE/Tfp pilus assembly ATPase PilB-like protein